MISDYDIYLFNEGAHFDLHDKLGAHLRDAAPGCDFAVWAPNAERVSVLGDFNDWQAERAPMQVCGPSGLWHAHIAEAQKGQRYKYQIHSRERGYVVDKADPFAFFSEVPPQRASVIWPLDHDWSDGDWMQRRARRQALDRPLSIYELHLGSWRRDPADPRRLLSYRELAEPLAAYVQQMGFTHVELLPIMEHPFYGSWGYQTTGYFAPSSRYGCPQDLMHLIDTLHQAGVGVLLDWVPSHFPSDEHGLAFFDGTHLFEHADPRQGFHPDWQSYIFNYGRHEVRAFLISSALFWLSRYHIDGLRVDAVASMLYLDYSRREGEWIPNIHGGRENLEAIDFLRRLNQEVHRQQPGALMIAEESTSWPRVTRPVEQDGLGFDLKWDMGWMHDSLSYMQHQPVHRSYHHNDLTFRSLYAEHENFALPLSHDEVVHGKGSLLGKMPGDDWQRFANLRLLYSYMYAVCGKKLLFMGAELAPWSEWSHEQSLDWHLARHREHAGVQQLLADLNRLYRREPALHQLDCDPSRGFAWVDADDQAQSCLSFVRRDAGAGYVLALFNFTPVPRQGYRLGVPRPGLWTEIFNSDAELYGGSNLGNAGAVETQPRPSHGQAQSLALVLPPLAGVYLRGPC